jgi:hypothetical protein
MVSSVGSHANTPPVCADLRCLFAAVSPHPLALSSCASHLLSSYARTFERAMQLCKCVVIRRVAAPSSRAAPPPPAANAAAKKSWSRRHTRVCVRILTPSTQRLTLSTHHSHTHITADGLLLRFSSPYNTIVDGERVHMVSVPGEAGVFGVLQSVRLSQSHITHFYSPGGHALPCARRESSSCAARASVCVCVCLCVSLLRKDSVCARTPDADLLSSPRTVSATRFLAHHPRVERAHECTHATNAVDAFILSSPRTLVSASPSHTLHTHSHAALNTNTHTCAHTLTTPPLMHTINDSTFLRLRP